MTRMNARRLAPATLRLGGASTLALSLLAVSACVVGPRYQRPTVDTPPAFKEAEGWTSAAPADELDRGPWWTLFDDAELTSLEADVAAHNQTLAGAEATYRQARALVAEARAAYFPTINLAVSTTGAGSFGKTASSGVIQAGQSTGATSQYEIEPGLTWAPDLWGKVRRQVESARATAQADAATAANTRLSLQTELAADYLQLRATDEEIRLYDKTAKGYEQVLKVSQNQYAAGTQAKSAVLTAQTELYDAQSQIQALQQTRQQLEHAIAVLAGRPPSELTLAPKPFDLKIPDVPVAVPSTLLQRRPDIAAAERAVKAANANVGVAVAAYYPTLTVTASTGLAGNSFGNLFNAKNSAWSLGASAAEPIFEGGLRGATVRAAKAARDQTVAQYRQTVLTALQQVEDELVALRKLEQEDALDRRSSAAADEAEKIVVNQYKAGTAATTDVVVAEQTALTERRNLITAQENRLTAVVTLIEALGGGWNATELRGKDK